MLVWLWSLDIVLVIIDYTNLIKDLVASTKIGIQYSFVDIFIIIYEEAMIK